ncbi:hypothetical protein [Blastococcus deserti]|uniref:DUF222 domain-containing protein n=1 Tax=Blastococcus deserti TaxID=2259033 RepID=A0ABW4XDZ2_9ACTN
MAETETPEPGDRSLLRRIADVAPAVAASTITGGADLALFGSPSVGAMTPLAEVVVEKVVEARLKRQQRMLEQAAEQVGGVDRFAKLATADDGRLELTARSIEAARRTTREEKIRALARVLANGVDGHASIDYSQILAGAIDSIEGPHIQVLAMVRDHANTQGGDFPPPDRAMSMTLETGIIAARMKSDMAVVGSVLQALSRQNLIEPVQGGLTYEQWGGADRWAITQLGRQCLTLLEAA